MKQFVLLCILALSHYADAQPKARLSGSDATCTALSNSAVKELPGLFRQHKTDSINTLLTRWRKKCGFTEPMVSFIILEEINNGTFYTPARRDPNAIHADELHLYKQQVAAYLVRYLYRSIDAYEPINDTADAAYDNYNRFIQSLALSMRQKNRLSVLERALVNYYAEPQPGDTVNLWRHLRLAQNGSGPATGKNKQVKEEKFDHCFGNEYTAMTGLWVPTGQFLRSGPLPFFGLTWGVEVNRVFFCIAGNIRIPNQHQFTINYNDTVSGAKMNGVGYLGSDWRYKWKTIGRNELELLAGAGIDAASFTRTNGRTTEVHATNVNAGLGYQIFLAQKQRTKDDGYRKNYLVIALKYNFVHYKGDQSAPPIGANAITLSLLLGDLCEWPR